MSKSTLLHEKHTKVEEALSMTIIFGYHFRKVGQEGACIYTSLFLIFSCCRLVFVLCCLFSCSADTTRQDKTRQDKTRQDKTRQDKTRQDKTRQDKTGDTTGRDKTTPKTRQCYARQDKTRHDKIR
jgi:hypothetical protein